GRFKPVLPRVPETEYEATHHIDSAGRERWIIRTNDGAKTFRVVEAPAQDPSKSNWKEMIAGRTDVTVESVTAFKDFLVVEERDRGLIKLRIWDFARGNSHYVTFDEPAYQASIGANAEYDTPWLRFNYTSLVTPHSIFDYN